MSIDAGAHVAIILLACGPCEVIVNCLGQVLYLGRTPRTKETLPDFREWCRVIRHPQLFCKLTSCQRDTPVLKRHNDYTNRNTSNTENMIIQVMIKVTVIVYV